MNQVKYPWWVKISLLGFSTKKPMLITLIIGLLVNIILFIFAQLLLAIAVLVCNILFYFSIRWVDKNGDWSEIKHQWANGRELVFGFVLLFILYILLKYLFGQ
jgi:hypothetical protein